MTHGERGEQNDLVYKPWAHCYHLTLQTKDVSSDAGIRFGRKTPSPFSFAALSGLWFIYLFISPWLKLVIMVWMRPPPFNVLNSLSGFQLLDRQCTRSFWWWCLPFSVITCTWWLAVTLGRRFNPSISITSRHGWFPQEQTQPSTQGCIVPYPGPQRVLCWDGAASLNRTFKQHLLRVFTSCLPHSAPCSSPRYIEQFCS